MIFAERKPVEELIEFAGRYKRVAVAGCATCVAECAVGGEEEVRALVALLGMALRRKGTPVTFVPVMLERQCEREFIEGAVETLEGVEAVISLACGIGAQALAERFDMKPVFPGVNTSALVIREDDGLWESRCAACGDCVLGETFGLCPIARCAKGLLNGPCGGTRENGKCEVNEEMDCIWTKIVERAEARGELDALTEVALPRDWSNSRHGGQKRVVREELQR
ncbi:MAG: hypothetical protein EOM20_11820 [Spartobacteria bacterium]|nr:hypothetical protein [Spartobacteria bacterium]